MFSYNKNDVYKNECVAWLSNDCSKLMLCSGSKNVDLCNFIAISPRVRKVDYQMDTTRNPFVKSSDIHSKILSLDLSDYFGYLNSYTRITTSVYNKIKKNFLGLISGVGFPIIDVYGIRLKDYLYGMDIGFEFKVSNLVSIYVDFGLVHKDNYGKIIVGCDYNGMDLTVNSSKRSCGSFLDGIFVIRDFVPSNISTMFPGVTKENILMLPNFTFVISDLYTYVEEDVIHIFELNSEDVFIKAFSIALSNYHTNANKMRQLGASICKKIATSKELTTGLSEIASSAIFQADDLTKIGHVNLCLSGNQDYIFSICKYEENRHQFLEVSHPDEELQFNLMYYASYISSLIGQCSAITDKEQKDILDIVLKGEYNYQNNKNVHFIRNANEDIIGMLPCLGTKPVSSSLTDTSEKEKLQSIIVSDNILTKTDVSNITADYMSQKEIIKDFEFQISELVSQINHINLDSIQQDLKKIDGYVSDAFKVLASLIASQEILSARGMVYLQQVDQILKMPLLTSYSAISFGNLIEFFDITTTSTGYSSVIIKDNLYVPYLSRQTVKKCGSIYTVLNSDPDVGYKNEVLIGNSYKSSISDLQGKFLSAYEKKYFITNRQTRGSGKSEKEVIPERTTEERVVMTLEGLLFETQQMIHTLLNNDVLRSLAQIQNCINKVSSSVTSYSKMREPYCNELIRYKEAEEKIFYLRHMINLAQSRFDFGYLTTNSDFEYVDSDIDTSCLSQTQVVRANSIINCIDVNDKVVEKDPTDIANRFANAITRFVNRIERGEVRYSHNIMPEVCYHDIEDIISGYKNEDEIRAGDYLIFLLQDNLIDCEGVETMFMAQMSYFNYLVIDIDEATTVIEEYKEYKLARENYAKTFSEIRKEIDNCLAEKHIIKFNNNEYYIDGDNKFVVTIDDERFVFRYIIEDNADEFIAKRKIELIPNESIIKADFDRVLSIRSLYYDIEVFLKHTEIFGLVPYSEYIDRKIKYCLLRDVDATYEQVYKRITEIFGKVNADYYGKWTRGSDREINPSQSDLLLALLCEFDLAFTSINAFQGINLRTLLQQKEVDAGLLSAYEEDRKKLC